MPSTGGWRVKTKSDLAKERYSNAWKAVQSRLELYGRCRVLAEQKGAFADALMCHYNQEGMLRIRQMLDDLGEAMGWNPHQY